jgi:hypothetical protein
VTPHKIVHMCIAFLLSFEVFVHKSLMMAQKTETCSLHENTCLCQMVSTVYFLNIMDTLCAYFFSSCVCVYVYMVHEKCMAKPTESEFTPQYVKKKCFMNLGLQNGF